MDIKYLKTLVKLLDESNLNELELEEEGTRIFLSKKIENIATNTQVMVPQSGVAPALTPTQSPTPQIIESEKTAETTDSKHHEITSPIVGTFYGSPSPDSDPFVTVGDKVAVGQTLCIIEAMKLMNEIESDVAGTIEKIILTDGNPVEYGQVLYLIKPD
jgi:acetyl-CoA carboxylase biotin carboxyl carrier protein